MGKIFFFTGEAFRAMRRNVAPTTAAVVTTVLTAILIGLGLDRVRRYVDSRPGYRVHLDRIQVLEKPSWLSDEDLASLRASAALDGSRGFFDPDLPEDVRDAWGRSPLLCGAPAVSCQEIMSVDLC